MKTLSLTSLIILSSLFLGLGTGCEKHEDDNQVVNVEIVSPTDNSKITDATNVLFHVIFTVDEELHEYKVEVTEKGKTDKILDVKGHQHEKSIIIKESRDLSAYPDGTEFELTASSCFDHDCEKIESKTITFIK